MFQALVVTLREGVEAALIVGITLVYLAKVGRTDLRKTVYAALITALLASIAGAVVLSYLPINQDKVEGWVMLVAAVFVISMVIFMMRTAHKLKGEIETKVDRWPATMAPGGACLPSFSSWSFAKALRPWSSCPASALIPPN